MWLFFLLSLFLTKPVFAQEATASATPTTNLVEQYQKDYTFQYNLYQQSYLVYLDKKQVYTKYGTVSSQKEKFDTAKAAIINRNNAFRTYLMTLRVVLDEHQTANPTDTESKKIDLSKWEAYFNEQNTVVSAINNDGDLTKWATEFQTKYLDVQQSIYSAITQDQINQRQTAHSLIKSLADQIKNSPKIKTDNTQWYGNLNVQSDLINQAILESLGLTKKPQFQTKFTDFYPDVKNNLNRIDSYLSQIFGNLTIIINQNYHE